VQGINHITTYYMHAFWFVLCGFDFCQLFELHANYRTFTRGATKKGLLAPYNCILVDVDSKYFPGKS